VSELVFGSRYRVTEKIGTGGMADVFKAQDEVLGRTVAVKMMHRHFAADPTFVQRFRQEANAAANLSSANIVNIFDWGEQGDTYFIVMEYVRGTDLKTLLDQRGPLPADKAEDYGAQVCSALAVAHGYGIIHRDIKPQNLILTGDGTVKVTDFGIARAGNTNMTQTGSVLGTAYYLSPEQAQGRELTPASDLYSLGIVLYELTTGNLPFVGDTPVSTALKQVNEPPVPPRQVNPGLPEPLQAIILHAMRKNPSERYQTADEMKKDLRAAAAGQPVAAMAGMGGAIAAGAMAAGAGTAVAGGAPMDQTSVMGRVPGQQPAAGARRPGVPVKKRRSTAWIWVLGVLALIAMLGGLAWAAFGGQLLGPPKVEVPSVVGRPAALAALVLKQAGLVPGKVTTATSDAVSANTVISQDPSAGTELPKGQAVSLVLSAGPAVAAVPDLAGLNETDAIRAIQSAGFTIGGISRRADAAVTSGMVISQEPKSGTTVRRGSAVSFVVSTGKPMASVPDVVGKSSGDAAAAVKEAGFRVDTVKRFSDTVTSGLIISQDPAGGAQAEKNSVVQLVVSKGPEQVTLPELAGQTLADAKSALQKLGLSWTIVDVPSLSDDGVVISTNPAGGSIVKPGDTIKLNVAKKVTPPIPPGP
jgi:beta-lactam-binding protein with PASTA domain/tRNA A-37 threonylcarbamoyl transferase component Bud32